MKIPEFKIRCSQIGKIMSGSLDLTESEQEKLNKHSLRKRQAEEGTAKPLTEPMEKQLTDLIKKRDTPDVEKMTQGMKSYCEEWLIGKIYGSDKIITSKYMQKGNVCEDEAIKYVGSVIMQECVKNEKEYENDYLTGTPDIILPAQIRDTKCSFDCFSFPLLAEELPNMDYYYQGQGYMALTGKEHYSVDYVLLDTPQDIIQREAWSVCRNQGIDPSSAEAEEIQEEVKNSMTYDIDDSNFIIKSFEFPINWVCIKEIYRRVEVCREYVEKLKERLKL